MNVAANQELTANETLSVLSTHSSIAKNLVLTEAIKKVLDQNDDLLVALREALQSLEYVDTAHPEVTGSAKRHADIIRARAAIAKAES